MQSQRTVIAMHENTELNYGGIAEPWDRQPGESSKAFAAFCIYRDTPPAERSVRDTTKKMGKKNTSYINAWCTKWKWIDRARIYDSEQDKLNRALQEKERKEMTKMHIGAARSMLKKALQGLQSIAPEEMKAGDISKMIEVASKLERLSRGEPSESTEITGKDGGAVPVQIYLPSNGREKKED